MRSIEVFLLGIISEAANQAFGLSTKWLHLIDPVWKEYLWRAEREEWVDCWQNEVPHDA
jgi:hypothetical protein